MRNSKMAKHRMLELTFALTITSSHHSSHNCSTATETRKYAIAIRCWKPL